MYNSVLINIDEIWLRGKNRRWYFEKFRNHILSAVHAHQFRTVKLHQEGPKIFVTSEEVFKTETLTALSKISGIRSLQPCRTSVNELAALQAAALEEITPLATGARTFRVETRRLNKSFPLNSIETSREVGAYILQNLPNLKAQMTHSDLTVSLRILKNHSFISTRKMQGPGGVPVGTSGKAVTLISGGFDSPVASQLMFRRGLEQVFVFFHSYPFVGNEILGKIRQIVGTLATYQMNTLLYIVPFGTIQKHIGEFAKPEYRTVLFRQYMLRTCEVIAAKNEAEALITGDSLSQVSSQTLANLAIADQTTKIPILRPLIGFNKYEIIDLAKKIGTHDICLQPQDDACALFAPKHPVIKGDNYYTDYFYNSHPLAAEIQTAVQTALKIVYNLKGEEKSATSDAPEKKSLFDLRSV